MTDINEALIEVSYAIDKLTENIDSMSLALDQRQANAKWLFDALSAIHSDCQNLIRDQLCRLNKVDAA